MAATLSLRVAGRRFDPFTRALRRQVAAFDAPASAGAPARSDAPARSAARLELHDEWLELEALQERLLGDGALRDGSLDLALVPTDWLAELIEDGHVAPLDDALPPDWERAWTPSLRALQTSADGAVHGVAYHDGPTMLLYRRDRLVAAGIEPPRDWDAFAAAARSLTDHARGRFGTVLAGKPDGHNDVYDFVAQLVARGGSLLDAHGAPAFDGPSGEQALQYLHDLWHRDRVVDPAAHAWDSVESGIRFAAGEGSLMVNWAGFAALSAAPGSPTHGLIGCAPPPGRALNVYWVMVVAAGSADLPLARAVTRHLATPAMDRITAQEGATATRRDSWADPAVQRLAPYYEVLEAAHRDAVTMPRTPRLPALAAVISQLVDAVIWRDHDLSRALTEACEQAAEALAASPTVHQGAPSR